MRWLRLWAITTGSIAEPAASPAVCAVLRKRKVISALQQFRGLLLVLAVQVPPAVNFKGLGKMLKDRVKDDEGWEFARGRALLIAETGNLLMMRPPKNKDAQETWMGHGTDLRESARALAGAAAEKDYAKSRAALAGLANACNRCHHTFRIGKRVEPFPEEEK